MGLLNHVKIVELSYVHWSIGHNVAIILPKGIVANIHYHINLGTSIALFVCLQPTNKQSNKQCCMSFPELLLSQQLC